MYYFSTAATAGIIVLLVLGALWLFFVFFVKPETDNVPDDDDTELQIKAKTSSSSSACKIQQTITTTTAKGGGGTLEQQKERTVGVKTMHDGQGLLLDGKLVLHGKEKMTDPIISSKGAGSVVTTFVQDNNLWIIEGGGGGGGEPMPLLNRVVGDDVVLMNGGSAHPVLYRLGGPIKNEIHALMHGRDHVLFHGQNSFQKWDQSEPAAWTSADGQLMVVVFAIRDRGLYRTRSVDGGKTWSATQLVVVEPHAFRPHLIGGDPLEPSVIHLLYFLPTCPTSPKPIKTLQAPSRVPKKVAVKYDVYYTSSGNAGIHFSPMAVQVASDLSYDDANGEAPKFQLGLQSSFRQIVLYGAHPTMVGGNLTVAY